MKDEVIYELARKHLDETVTVYFANEYVKGHWFSIDAHTNVIGVDVRVTGKKQRNDMYIDISCINAIEVWGQND